MLLAGLTWFAGLWGLGRILCIATGLRLPSPWAGVVATLLGIQLVSLIVQVLGMAGFASRPALTTIWGMVTALGLVSALLFARRRRIQWGEPSWLLMAPLAIVVLAAVSGLLVAVAPSTKIDEIYYHMLLPSRIVLDGELHFYRAPWIAAVWPQMVYEISSTPLHAIGFPDAPNVTSWGLGILLLGFAWRFVRAHGAPPVLAAILLGALCVGLYSTVWYGNAGAHAMGDLAMVAAIASFADRQRLIAAIGHARLGAMVSLLLVCAATSKISLLPVCTIMVGLNAWLSFRAGTQREVLRALAAVMLPWLVFYVPIMVWTWVQSGSPFGPMMAGVFGPSLYEVEKIQAALRHARDGFQPTMSGFLFSTGVNYSPLIWLGLLGLVISAGLSRSLRLCFAALFMLQCGLIFFLLPHDVRFLGGLHFGFLVVAVAFSRGEIRRLFEDARIPSIACALCLLPWLAAQLYYAQSFFLVSTGLEKRHFYQRNVAHFDDYMALDKLLPRDAVLLAAEGHTSALYAPRPIFFDPRDLPGEKRPFLFRSLANEKPASSIAPGYTPGRLIYSNDQSNAMVFRTGRPPRRSRLEVSELRKEIGQ